MVNTMPTLGHVKHKHIYLTVPNNVNFYTFKIYIMFTDSLSYSGGDNGFYH